VNTEIFIAVIVGIFCGLAYAWLFYSSSYPWTKIVNILLATLRFLIVAILVFLLLAPVLKYFQNEEEKPVVVFAIDNSRSISENKNLNEYLAKIKEQSQSLLNNGIDVKFHILGSSNSSQNIDNVKFNENNSDISGMLSAIKTNYDGKNLASVVLFSDGIYSSGASPIFNSFPFEINTLAIGDTSTRKDIILNNSIYNNIVSLDSKTPLIIEILNDGFKGEITQVSVMEGKNQLASKNVEFNSNSGYTKVEFIVEPKEKGLHHYVVNVKPLKNEFSTKNNSAHIYLDVIEAKLKILIAAASPHPDIQALTTSILNNPTIDFETYIPGIYEYKEGNYDLIIFHQIPNIYRLGAEVYAQFLKKQTPIMFILGSISDYNNFSTKDFGLSIKNLGSQTDKVLPALNPEFNKFTLNIENLGAFSTYSPLQVPYAEFGMQTWENILFQKVGNTITNKPLLAVKINGTQNLALLTGEGIWQWRMNEIAQNDDSKLFEELFFKLLTLLAKKEDKSRFRVKLTKNEFTQNENIELFFESYNEIYEKIYGNQINILVKSEGGKKYDYRIVTNENNYSIQLSGMSSGVYNYDATTTISGKLQQVKGQFLIATSDAEISNLKADFELLRKLATQQNGSFYDVNSVGDLSKKIIDAKPKNKIHTAETFSQIINFWWIMVLILSLISLEWVVRKRMGGY
jgi:hypothetical protein